MDVLKLVRDRRPEMLEHVKKNETAIKIVFELLEKGERRLIEARQDAARHHMEIGMDRDRVNYLMGTTAECREILMCLGVDPTMLNTKSTEEMKKAYGWR